MNTPPQSPGQARQFSCRIQWSSPGYEVWLREDQYLGIRTDVVCAALGERVRVGGTWSSDWLVGSRKDRRAAARLARKTLRRAERKAAREERSDERWERRRAKGEFDAFIVRSQPRYRDVRTLLIIKFAIALAISAALETILILISWGRPS